MSDDLRAQDEAARRLVQTRFDLPLLLEAGAGTGKTAALVARAVAWSLGPGWEGALSDARGSGEPAEAERVAARVLRRVVAITFTEAAAAEMGDRVADALREIEAGRLPPGFFSDALTCPPGERAPRAAALSAALDQMRVHTIHAFCRRLLAEHPIDAGVHPRFEVDADESQQRAAVREVLRTRLAALLDDSDALLRLARAGVALHEIEPALLFLLREGAPPELLDEDPLAAPRIAALFASLAAPVAAFADAERSRLEALGSRAPKVSACAAGLRRLAERLGGSRAPGRDDLDALVAWLGESGIDPDTVEKWGKGNLGARGSAALGEDAEALAERARALVEPLRHALLLDPERLAAARALLAPLHREVCERLRARGVETFPALLRDARALLADRPAILARVRRQIDQLLVDEFQDTDAMQCEVVRMLALEGPPEERPGLFLVGDPKQSIYGWRSADLGAYESFRDRVLAAGGEVHALVVNHRSVPAVLDEVARVIEPVMRPLPGLQPRFERLLPSRENAARTGLAAGGLAAVEHWVSWRWDEDAAAPAKTRAAEGYALEADAVAAEAARLHELGVPWKAVGLLFRAGTDLETYLAALRRAGVPFAVEGDRSYFERREIIEAGALVRCALDPHDQVALLTLLRSSIVGVPDAALIPLWERELPARMAELYGPACPALAAVSRLAGEAAAALPGGVPGLARVAGWSDSLVAAARSLALLRASFEEDPADVFVEKLRRLWLFEATEAARYLGAYRVANLERFFHDLLAALRDGEGDPHALLRALREDVMERREAEEGRPLEAIEDAVQVMTIHKAKGLAFEHVYVLQLHKGGGRQPQPRVEEVDGRVEYELLGARTLGYDRVLARRKAVEENERVRTLYVAMTRARARLVLAGVHPEHAAVRVADSAAALLAFREGGLPDLDGAMAAARGAGPLDAAGARFRFPALEAAGRGAPQRQPAARLEVEVVRRESEALAARRAAAAAARERPFGAPISRAAHEAALEAWREGPAADAGPEEEAAGAPGRAPSDVAAAVGTAVHRLLERLDLGAELAAELARRRREVEDELVRALPPADATAARERAAELLERFARGSLAARLSSLAPHVLARELPVLLPPGAGDAEEPSGYLSGAVDLLYRDPQGGELVVADYKTDRIDAGPGLLEHAARYAGQGAGYVRAVQEALGLPAPPRFELWFLHAGAIVRLPAERSGAPAGLLG